MSCLHSSHSFTIINVTCNEILLGYHTGMVSLCKQIFFCNSCVVVALLLCAKVLQVMIRFRARCGELSGPTQQEENIHQIEFPYIANGKLA